jgi:hypothetical protein
VLIGESAFCEENFMKLFIALLLTVAATTASAVTYYGNSGNEDITSIFVVEYSLKNCEEGLAAAQAKLKARNKVVISTTQCTESKNGKGEPSRFAAVIRFHKYL